MKTILIIEDDISIARLIKTYVSFAGYEAAIAPDGTVLWRAGIRGYCDGY